MPAGRRREAPPSGALSGVVVLDITRVVAGPYCSMILADLGATVIKVEHPADPDYTREFPPTLVSEDGAEFSAFFAQYNRNKLGITLNLGDRGRQAGAPGPRRRARTSSSRTSGRARWTSSASGYEALREVNPRLVYTAISGYGQTGPLQPPARLRQHRPGQRRPLVDERTTRASRRSASAAIIGDLAATFVRRHRDARRAPARRAAPGAGQLVDISQQDSVLALTENAVVVLHGDRERWPRRSATSTRSCARTSCSRARTGTSSSAGTPTSSGGSAARSSASRSWPTIRDRHHGASGSTRRPTDRGRPLIDGWFAGRTKAELEEIAGDLVPLTAVKDIGEVVDDPQIAAREMVVDVDYPRVRHAAACSGRRSSSAGPPTTRAAWRPGSAPTPTRCCARCAASTTTGSRNCVRGGTI